MFYLRKETYPRRQDIKLVNLTNACLDIENFNLIKLPERIEHNEIIKRTKVNIEGDFIFQGIFNSLCMSGNSLYKQCMSGTGDEQRWTNKS